MPKTVFYKKKARKIKRNKIRVDSPKTTTSNYNLDILDFRSSGQAK